MKLPGVPQAKQGREGAHQWAWTEAEVWNERMLANLERGITGGKWYSLMDKVWKMVNLKRAVQKVARGKSRKKADGRKCRRYAEESAQRLAGLQAQLQSGSYQPKPVQRVWIPKLGSKELRPIGIPEVENRVVEMAVRNVIEPIFEHSFAQHSYGFRPGRGAKDALRRVDELLKQGKVWVVDADLKGYFDSIPQDKLMEAVSQLIADGALLELIEKFLKQGVMETGKGWSATEPETPQGGSMSEIAANINQTIRGWMGYFKHSYHTTFPTLDKWVRGRLRTIQRKRHKGKGRGRGNDHIRWPNAYFAELGLISMVLVRAKAANLS